MDITETRKERVQRVVDLLNDPRNGEDFGLNLDEFLNRFDHRGCVYTSSTSRTFTLTGDYANRDEKVRN